MDLAAKISLTIVVPVRNEELTILDFLEELNQVCKMPFQVLVVYDSEDDNTLNKRAQALSLFKNLKFVRNQFGRGFINALKTGIAETKTEYLVPMMADLSDDPKYLSELYAKASEGYDVVIASRYCKGGRKIGGPAFKALLSKLAGQSLHLFTKIPTHDITNAYVLHRTEKLKLIQIESSGGFEVAMELIVKSYLAGYKMTETPTINRDRGAGASKFRFFSWIRKYLYWYFVALLGIKASSPICTSTEAG